MATPFTADSRPPASGGYAAALAAIRRHVTVTQLLLLQHHYSSPGRTTTARRLGECVGYADHRGANSQYGTLAKRLAEDLGLEVNGDHVFLLATFTADPDVEGGETQLVMRPQVAAALERLGWAPGTRAERPAPDEED